MSIVDELFERIKTAQEELLKYEIKANTVVLNGNKYGRLINGKYKPTICGLAVEANNLPDNMDFLVQYVAPMPKTNADCIRAMTDEELAEHLDYLTNGCGCMDCVAEEYCKKIVEGSCRKAWLEWLKREVDE